MAHTQYRNDDGKRLPSVTTVLGKFKDPGALMWWSWNTAYQVLQDAVDLLSSPPSNTLSQRKAKFLRSGPLDEGNYRKKSTAAANAGTFAHSLIEQWIHATRAEKLNLEKLTPKDFKVTKNCRLDVAKRAITAFNNFLEWIKTTHFRPQKTELKLTSEEYQFGGTIDCIGRLNGNLVMFDWKTSNRIYYDYLCQLAAYGILWNENNPHNQITEFHIIRITKDSADFHHHRFDDLEDAAEMFLLLRQAYNLISGLEARTK